MNNIINDLGYTGIGGLSSKRKNISTKRLPKLVAENQNKTFDENIDNSDNLQGERSEKLIIASNIIDIYNRLEN